MGGVRAKRANESVTKARNLLIAKSEQADDGGVLQNGRLRVLRRGPAPGASGWFGDTGRGKAGGSLEGLRCSAKRLASSSTLADTVASRSCSRWGPPEGVQRLEVAGGRKRDAVELRPTFRLCV